jgi:hypothetical protein
VDDEDVSDDSCTDFHHQIKRLHKCWDGLLGLFDGSDMFHAVASIPIPLSNQAYKRKIIAVKYGLYRGQLAYPLSLWSVPNLP